MYGNTVQCFYLSKCLVALPGRVLNFSAPKRKHRE